MQSTFCNFSLLIPLSATYKHGTVEIHQYINCLSPVCLNNPLISLWISTKLVSAFLLCMLYQSKRFLARSSYLILFDGNFYTAG